MPFFRSFILQGHASRDMLHTVRRIRLFAGASAAQVEKVGM